MFKPADLHSRLTTLAIFPQEVLPRKPGDASRLLHAHLWLKHENMDFEPEGIMPDQPGINGVRGEDHAGSLWRRQASDYCFPRLKT